MVVGGGWVLLWAGDYVGDDIGIAAGLSDGERGCISGTVLWHCRRERDEQADAHCADSV